MNETKQTNQSINDRRLKLQKEIWFSSLFPAVSAEGAECKFLSPSEGRC